MMEPACTENHTVRSEGQQGRDTNRVRLTSDMEKAPSQQLDSYVSVKRSSPNE